jgi:hypothetical protein
MSNPGDDLLEQGEGDTGNTVTEMPHESPLGKSYVGLVGVLAITAYLVLLSLFDFYLIVKVWPPERIPSESITKSQPPQSLATGSTGSSTGHTTEPSTSGLNQVSVSANPQLWQVNFFWCDNSKPEKSCWIYLNTSLFLIAMLGGALGSLLHSLRSLYWYAGNRKLIWSWAVMYILLPFSGAVLATIFYVVIRAGFLPQSGPQSGASTPYAFAALGALVGLFSEEAVLKLKQVAETVFAKTEQGKDRAAAVPKVTSIFPSSGPAAGGTSVTITGADFAPGARVNIGGAPTASVLAVTKSSITATTAPHAAGPANVEVINPDGQKDALTGGYTYI